jgi:hypothetical protein
MLIRFLLVLGMAIAMMAMQDPSKALFAQKASGVSANQRMSANHRVFF